MGLFGESNNGQIEALQKEVGKLRDANKKGSTELAQERQRSAGLQSELATLRADLERIRAATLKARRRQKNSVERANRFKKKVATLVGSAASE